MDTIEEPRDGTPIVLHWWRSLSRKSHATTPVNAHGVGWSPREVAEQLGLKLDTLRKAIQQGRLTEPFPPRPGEPTPEKTPVPQPPTATDKSTRAVADAAAEMGTACTRPDERVLAAFGLLNGASDPL